MARPSDYTDEIAAAICERLSEGESLNRICKDPHMPSAGTVFRWLQKHDMFRENYVRAKEEAAELMAEEILDIADEPPAMTAEGKIDAASVQHQRLRIDTRKWIAAKLKPKKYGDKLELAGDKERPLNITVRKLSDD